MLASATFLTIRDIIESHEFVGQKSLTVLTNGRDSADITLTRYGHKDFLNTVCVSVYLHFTFFCVHRG